MNTISSHPIIFIIEKTWHLPALLQKVTRKNGIKLNQIVWQGYQDENLFIFIRRH